MSKSPIARNAHLNAAHTKEVAEAIAFLHQFMAAEQNAEDSEFPKFSGKSLQTQAEKEPIHNALTIVLNESEYQNLGICADNHQDGILALQQYLAAFGEEVQPTCGDPGKPLYIKYNGKTQGCYSEPYDGSHRGVIVSCYSSYDDGVNETFGHFPLDLFAP
jgi:Domain of unknown function (DUF1824)